MENLTTDNTMAEIVEAYNSLTDLKIKKFTNKSVGIQRLNKLLGKIEKTETSVQTQVLAPIEKAGGLFPTCEEDLSLPNGEVIPDKKAIVDCDTMEYVSTVGKGYNVINNRECFTHFANVLAGSDLNTEGMKVKSYITKSKCYVRFNFPAHSVEILKGDVTELSITARNSYDGSSRFTLDIGGFRLICSNGQGIGSYTNVYSNKHSSGYDPNKMAAYLETAVEVFNTAGEEWKQMTEIPVSDRQALDVLKISTEKKSNLEYEEILEGKNTKLKEAVLEWERYKDEMGSNKFALYNTVTHLSTHVSTEKGNLVGLKIYKEKLRDKALSSAAFKAKPRKTA